jgi:hypothetical protein
VNRFASRTIEVEAAEGDLERTLRTVRHDMYLGSIVMWLSMPLTLGSHVACLCASGFFYVYRLLNEKKFLRREPPGYCRMSGKALPFSACIRSAVHFGHLLIVIEQAAALDQIRKLLLGNAVTPSKAERIADHTRYSGDYRWVDLRGGAGEIAILGWSGSGVPAFPAVPGNVGVV